MHKEAHVRQHDNNSLPTVPSHPGPAQRSTTLEHIQWIEIVVRSRNIDGVQLTDCVRDEFDSYYFSLFSIFDFFVFFFFSVFFPFFHFFILSFVSFF